VPALLDRFPVGLVTLTPSFRDRPTSAVRTTLEVLEKRGVPTRVASAGNVFAAGDVVFEKLRALPYAGYILRIPAFSPLEHLPKIAR
jgi:hypothetical protein